MSFNSESPHGLRQPVSAMRGLVAWSLGLGPGSGSGSGPGPGPGPWSPLTSFPLCTLWSRPGHAAFIAKETHITQPFPQHHESLVPANAGRHAQLHPPMAAALVEGKGGREGVKCGGEAIWTVLEVSLLFKALCSFQLVPQVHSLQPSSLASCTEFCH